LGLPQFSKVTKLCGHAAAQNQASCRVFEKAGFQKEGIVLRGFQRNGVFMDMVCYGLLLPAKEQVKKQEQKDVVLARADNAQLSKQRLTFPFLSEEQSNDELIESASALLWEYLCIREGAEAVDCIVGLGNPDVHTAQHAAELYLSGRAPFVLFTGGRGPQTKDWPLSEAETFAEIAVKMGVPQSKILVESKSTNTTENIRFSQALLQSLNLKVSTVVLVQKPAMMRRCKAQFLKQWPELTKVCVSAPACSSVREYAQSANAPVDSVIHAVVGDVQRCLLYGLVTDFQVPQPAPQELLTAFATLVGFGYTKNLVPKS